MPDKKQFIFSLLTAFILSFLPNSFSADEMNDQSAATITAPARETLAQAYVDEFVSGHFAESYPVIYQAIRNVLSKLPEEVFTAVTDRRRPVILINSITSGIARFAHSTEFVMRPGDALAFQDGFFLIVLGDELNMTEDPETIEGIIFHELAHRYLEHLRSEKFSCDMEREANRLVKTWGFEKEYEKASDAFGSKQKGDSPCQEEK